MAAQELSYLHPTCVHEHDASLLRWTGYGQASGNRLTGPTAYFLEYKYKLV